MKLAVMIAVAVALVASESAGPLIDNDNVMFVDIPEGAVDQPDESRAAPAAPIASNLDPQALTLEGEQNPQYHAAVGVSEAARIQEVENKVSSRIAGGLGSYVGEHPFFGGLVITLQTGQTSVCGSSLLTSSKVVTAAHCWHDGVDTAYSMLVVLGSVRLFYGGVRVYASQVVAHALYSPGIRTNDIALLTIPSVAFSSSIKPIAIASGSETFVGYTAEAIGFGRISDSSPITESASLRDVFVSVISNSACQSYYGSIVTSGIMCTSGSAGRNPCGGDSGGPLILYSAAGNDVLIGLVNFVSSSGCTSGAPGGYVRVSYHASWILVNA